MSIIGTIRNRYAWLILALIALAILAFLIMDGTSGKGGSLTGAGKAVGYVNGQKIKLVDYQAKITEIQNLYPNATQEQVQNTAWNELVEERVYKSRFKDLGLNVPNQELADLMKGSEPHQYARQLFSSLSPDGQYDQQQAIEIVNNPMSVPNGELAVRQLKHSIQNDVINKKYTALLQNGINTPTWMAKDEFVKEYKTVNFDYVMLPYSLVPESDISITDNDLLNYSRNHKSKYEAKDGYVLEYVEFDIVPSKQDSTAQMVKVQGLKQRFEETERPQPFARDFSNATTLAQKINARLPYQKASDIKFKEPFKTQILESQVNEVVGPFIDEGVIYMSRTIDKKNVADSARVRHILISDNFQTPEGYERSKEVADSLADVLRQNPSKWDALAKEYSTDPGSKDNGGVYEWFPQGQMVPAFNEVSFNGEIGKIEVIETNYGFHVVEPLGRKGNSMGYELAVVAQNIKPSKETRTLSYDKAREFEENSRSAEDFTKNALPYGGVKTTPNVPLNARAIPDLGDNREIMRWAIQNPENTTRYFANSGDKSYVVRIKNKTKQGEIDIEDHRIDLTNAVRNEKKAVILEKQIEEAGGASTPLNDLAPKLNRTVQKATDAKFGSSGTTIGYEPELISSLFTKGEGQVKHPIQGSRGVYVVNVTSFGSLPPQEDFDKYKTTIDSRMKQHASLYAVQNQMEEQGKIIDERYKVQ